MYTVLFSTSQLRENGKEFAGEGLHLVVSQSDVMDVVHDTVQHLEDAVWEGNKLAVGQICREMRELLPFKQQHNVSHLQTKAVQSISKKNPQQNQ